MLGPNCTTKAPFLAFTEKVERLVPLISKNSIPSYETQKRLVSSFTLISRIVGALAQLSKNAITKLREQEKVGFLYFSDLKDCWGTFAQLSKNSITKLRYPEKVGYKFTTQGKRKIGWFPLFL